MQYCKKITERNTEILMMVRLGETDVRILTKEDNSSNWNNVSLPDNLPQFNNNVLWDGLSQSKILAEIEEFSPTKGPLPSEKNVAELVKTVENLAKRKEVSPPSHFSKKHK